VNVTLPAAVFPVVAVKVALAVFVGASVWVSSLHPSAVEIQRPIRRELIRMMAVVSSEVEVKALFWRAAAEIERILHRLEAHQKCFSP